MFGVLEIYRNSDGTTILSPFPFSCCQARSLHHSFSYIEIQLDSNRLTSFISFVTDFFTLAHKFLVANHSFHQQSHCHLPSLYFHSTLLLAHFSHQYSRSSSHFYCCSFTFTDCCNLNIFSPLPIIYSILLYYFLMLWLFVMFLTCCWHILLIPTLFTWITSGLVWRFAAKIAHNDFPKCIILSLIWLLLLALQEHRWLD